DALRRDAAVQTRNAPVHPCGRPAAPAATLRGIPRRWAENARAGRYRLARSPKAALFVLIVRASWIWWLAGVAAAAACSSDDESPDVMDAPPDLGGGFLVGDEPGAEDPAPGADDPGAQCLGETHQAERIGLDMFVMLDISGSMLDVLPQGLLAEPITKWDAVRQSLEAFVVAPETADIGIGLQYFPQNNDGVPFTCNSNDECGAGGPCTNSLCVAP